MKEQDIAWLHLYVDEFEAFLGFMNAFEIGACLVTRQHVIHSAQVMGAFQDLHATVLTRGPIHCDECTREQRKQDSVLIPVTIILMPSPSAPDLRIFHDHLGMVVIDLTLKERFGRIDET